METFISWSEMRSSWGREILGFEEAEDGVLHRVQRIRLEGRLVHVEDSFEILHLFSLFAVKDTKMEAPHLTASAIRKQSQPFPPFRFCSLCKTLQAFRSIKPLNCPPKAPNGRTRSCTPAGGGAKVAKFHFFQKCHELTE